MDLLEGLPQSVMPLEAMLMSVTPADAQKTFIWINAAYSSY